MLAPSRTVSTITGPKEVFGTILPPIDVDPVCAGAVDSASLLAEPLEIGREDRRRYDDRPHLASCRADSAKGRTNCSTALAKPSSL